MPNAVAQDIPHLGATVYLEGDGPTQPLLGFDAEFDTAAAAYPETTATILDDVNDPDAAESENAASALLVTITHEAESYPGVRLPAPDGSWDLSTWQFINIDIENVGEHRITLGLRADNPGADDDESLRTYTTDEFDPGERKTLSLRLSATRWALHPPLDLVGMRETPGVFAIDPTRIVKLIVFSVQPKHDERFIIRNVRAETSVTPVDASTFLPFVDRYGQFAHTDWPGKVTHDEQLIEQRGAEADEIAARPGPTHFNAYGGWVDGPQLEATGSFYVTQYEGKWWFVDPDGRLFWSHGVDCVSGIFGVTGIEHRESYFAGLPDEDDPLAAHYLPNETWAPHGFYRDKLPYRMFDFQNANLQRKYGERWREAYADLAHLRLRSWGMNTLAAWAAPEIYRQQRTAYTTHVWIEGARPIEGSTGYWGQFPDVFDDGFRAAARRCIGAYDVEATDPWNIGYYVDNELAWGDEIELALAALTSPADQAAKLAFIEDLQERYQEIAAINAAWRTDYASWDTMLEATELPEILTSDPAKNREADLTGARPDLTRFYQRLCETYFRVIKEELHAIAPDKLYLGCRFAWRNPTVVRASAAHCDVVSFNIYRYSVADLSLPDDLDRPMIIGEFSFGSGDAGGFPPTSTRALNQAHRGELYEAYVTGALNHPAIVGTHWFQYVDQAVSGRPDEENFNVGLIALTDLPHAPLIDAVRRVGYRLYEIRAAD